MSASIGIVVSEFNSDITSKMLDCAVNRAKAQGAIVQQIMKVPGAFEIPFAVKYLLKNPKIEGVATLGAVITGDTGHDVIVAETAACNIADLSLQFMKPVSLGICGPKMSREQAIERIDEYAGRSIDTVLSMIRLAKEARG